MATKPARKKATKRRKSAVSGPPKTKKFGDKRYTHQTCGTKSAMQKKAATHRKKGKNKTARVVKNGKGYCLYTRG